MKLSDIQDPDLRQAIDDLTPVAEEMRRDSALLLREANSVHRASRAGFIRDLYARIALRAERIGMQPGALVEILNAVIDTRARRGRNPPLKDTRRSLLTAATLADARIAAATEGLTAAQTEMEAATKHRAAVEQACRVFGTGRIGA